MRKVIFLFFAAIVLAACTSEGPEEQITGCNSPEYNSKFQQIRGEMTYNEIKLLFGQEGDNYRNDFNGQHEINYYKWYPCPATPMSHFVECWFMNDLLILANKTFQDNSCSNNISSQSFNSLALGMTYDQVTALIGDQGDNYRNDYDYPDPVVKIAYYRFYNCSDLNKYIEVILFAGSGVGSFNKNF